MGGPVTKVQGARGTKLEGVTTSSDVVEVQLRTAVNQAEHGWHVTVSELLGLLFEEVKECGVFEEGDFDSFGDATTPVTR